VASRGIQAHLVSELRRPWGEARSCTACGKCVQVCPTGAMAENGHAKGEMVKRDEAVTRLAASRHAR
jgi:bidirectional [NiFe] hydrogenase diaphorase subunit